MSDYLVSAGTINKPSPLGLTKQGLVNNNKNVKFIRDESVQYLGDHLVKVDIVGNLGPLCQTKQSLVNNNKDLLITEIKQ